MKRSEIKVGREYVVKVGGRYGFTAREMVLAFEGVVIVTRGGYGERCRRMSRHFVKAVELTQELRQARAELKPSVVGFTEDGLPLTAEAISKTLVKVCDETRGDTRLVVSRPETPAERIARVHAEAMARS